MEKAKIIQMINAVNYQENSIVSSRILENAAGGITLFAFDKEQRLSEHTAPFDATIQILDGEAEIMIGGKSNLLKPGELIVMPAKVPHAVNAITKFKMMLIMIKG